MIHKKLIDKKDVKRASDLCTSFKLPTFNLVVVSKVSWPVFKEVPFSRLKYSYNSEAKMIVDDEGRILLGFDCGSLIVTCRVTYIWREVARGMCWYMCIMYELYELEERKSGGWRMDLGGGYCSRFCLCFVECIPNLFVSTPFFVLHMF